MITTNSSIRQRQNPRNDLNEILQETFALTWRLFIQLIRRPSTLFAGILQPLIWLFLFAALFSKAPIDFLPGGSSYGEFLGAGLIVFTAFSGCLLYTSTSPRDVEESPMACSA